MRQTINGADFRRLLISAAASVEIHKQALNELNVFPVPDGDTGTNMSMTMMSAVKELSGIEDGSVGQIASAVARGALKGARGNSGVILSQILRGFAEGLKGMETADAKALSECFSLGTDKAYKAVMKPKEGTILTVAKAVSEFAEHFVEEDEDIYGLFDGIVEEGNNTLKKTPDMLPVLKSAGVVDSGGAGLMAILVGFKMAVNGEAVENVTELSQKLSALGSSKLIDMTPAGSGASMDTGEEIEFGYCTETFITNVKPSVTMEDIDRLRAHLMEFGDCVLVVGDTELIKVHCHSNDPGRILRYAIQLGDLDNVKVDNMRTQHRHLIEEAEQVTKNNAHEITEEVGFVSVCAGEGIAELFKQLSVNEIVSGGQTMNPSAEDIVEAVYRCKAKVTYVLPNNKNIIMAANQAKELAEDRTVIVIPTKTIPQGISAMIGFNPEGSAEENEAGMTEAAEAVLSGSVTYAIRDTNIGEQEIHEGDVLCLNEGDIAHVGKDVKESTLELLKAMVSEEASVITLLYGQDVTDEDAEKLQNEAQALFPDCDVEVISGKQPLYYYLISVE